MVAASSRAAIPAALRPRDRPQPRQLHAAVITDDPRVHKFLRNRCFLMGPTDLDVRLTLHLFQQDTSHEAVRLDERVRWALVENGLVLPEQVGLITPVDIEIGRTD